jgi:hypothetical protein
MVITMKNNNLVTAEYLFQQAISEKFGVFAYSLFSSVKNSEITLTDLEKLYLFFYVKNVEYSNSEDFDCQYLGVDDICLVSTRMIVSVLKYAIKSKQVFVKGNNISDETGLFRISEIKNTIQDNCDDKCNIKSSYTYMLDSMNDSFSSTDEMSFSMLNNIKKETADIVMFLNDYLYSFEIDSVEKLKEKQSVFPEEYTWEELRELNAKTVNSVFCFSFLEQADSY